MKMTRDEWEALRFPIDCLLAKMEDDHVTYHELARRMGTSKGSMHRDLHRRNIGTWSVAKLLRLFTVMGFKLQCKMVKLSAEGQEGAP